MEVDSGGKDEHMPLPTVAQLLESHPGCMQVVNKARSSGLRSYCKPSSHQIILYISICLFNII